MRKNHPWPKPKLKKKKKEKLKRLEIRKIKEKLEKLEKESNTIDTKIHQLTEISLKEGFYDDQEKVIKTFEKIKNLEDRKQKVQDMWLDLSLELEEN